MADDLLGLGKATEALSKPLQDFLTKLLGPTASEAGELLADRIRFLRWKNTLHILEQSKQELDKRKLTVQNIPLKTLFPILEGASLESDDENLQTKWSNLLVSAAIGNSTHPSYPKILSEIISSEAKLLDYLYPLEMELKLQQDHLKIFRAKLGSLMGDERETLFNEMYAINRKITDINHKFRLRYIETNLSFSKQELSVSVENLLRLRCCEHPEESVETQVITSASLTQDETASLTQDENEEKETYKYELDIEDEFITTYSPDLNSIRLTTLGKNFMKACRAEPECE